jgi:hypothetical protein
MRAITLAYILNYNNTVIRSTGRIAVFFLFQPIELSDHPNRVKNITILYDESLRIGIRMSLALRYNILSLLGISVHASIISLAAIYSKDSNLSRHDKSNQLGSAARL